MEESDSSEWNKFKEVSTKKKKYRCQCGKVYNTAGSLTTHVKMQHGGVRPLPEAVKEKPLRGRPKQYQYKQFKLPQQQGSNPLVELLQIQRSSQSSFSGSKQMYEGEAVYALIKKYMEETGAESELRFNEDDKIFEVKMGPGLVILIKELEQTIQQKSYFHELVLMLTIYIACVIEETEDQNVLNNGSIELLPEFANVFILYDLNNRCQRLKLTNTWISNASVVIKTLHVLFRWLNYKQFTHTTALISHDDSEHKQPDG